MKAFLTDTKRDRRLRKTEMTEQLVGGARRTVRMRGRKELKA